MYHTETKTLKALKPHRCMSCGEAIAVGDTYKRWRTYDDGDAGTNKMHPECLAMHQADSVRFSEPQWEYSLYAHDRPKRDERPCTCHPDDSRPENLAAMCQRHHLAYDAQHHAQTAYATRKARAWTMDLF